MTVIGTKADFSQNDVRWKSNLLGFSTWEKLGPYGCFVTAMANVAQAMRKDFTPATMNQKLKEKGLFVRDTYGQVADTSYEALAAAVPGIKFVERQSWPGSIVAPGSYFDVRNTTNTEIIVMLDYHPETAGVQTHFCRVIGTNAKKDDVEIVDSYTGKRIWLSSISSRVGKKGLQIIWSAGKYQKTL